ncbi:MAG: glycosyltransferase family 9 protein [Candidatus Omnitrophica bacterium]|nr:glycosyltransferase family 9 protein [Candidatus Omnitrophota bacterium]
MASNGVYNQGAVDLIMKILPDNIADIQNVLIITLSNIGDVVLTFPVINIVKENLPEADVSLLVGPKAEGLFVDNPYFKHVYPFQKKQSAREWLRFVLSLRRERFDCVIDLRQTFIPVLLNCRYHTSFFKTPHQQDHMRFKHLNRLKSVFPDYRHQTRDYCLAQPKEGVVVPDPYLKELKGQKYIILSPGAADQAKRWPEERYVQLCQLIRNKYSVKIVLVGDNREMTIAENIKAALKDQVYNFCGQTTLRQLSCLIRHSCFFVGNDSAVMHMASYHNIPSVAVFGPTNPVLYGPWSEDAYAIRHNQDCAGCQRREGGQGHTCLRAIQAKEAWDQCQILMCKINLI